MYITLLSARFIASIKRRHIEELYCHIKFKVKQHVTKMQIRIAFILI